MQPRLAGSFPAAEIERRLRAEGFGFEVAGQRCLLRSNTGLLAGPLRQLYADYPADLEPHGFYDFRIEVRKSGGLPWQPTEVEFDWEGSSAFPAMPLAHAHPLFEWGLNWCIATANGWHTVVHAAVVEKHGKALVLPGDPGSGKSTLCAALVLSGWRLLSDELTIVSQSDGLVQPMPRPISLKNRSIDVIRARFPDVDMTPPVVDTLKGAIAYARPPRGSVLAATQAVPIGHVVFPKFRAGLDIGYEPLSRARGLTELMQNTFNVGLMGSQGFAALARAISGAQCHAVEYGDTDSILAWIEDTCVPPR